ncbi:MAG: S8 family serine peptidase [Candidatus Heimdallarchaeaceae archaeon]
MRVSKIFSFYLIIVLELVTITGLAPIPSFSKIPQKTVLNGTIGSTVPNPAIKVGQLQDTAYTYTGADCVVNDYGVHIDDHVTIVVIDTGLHSNSWKALEQNPEANVDIIGFLTEDYDENTVKYITNPDDPYLEDQTYGMHALEVISVIASIARDVKVIVVDLEHLTDPYGFELDDYKLWEWIDDNQASKDIDIVSASVATKEDFASSSILQIWDSLISKGVILIASAGNYGNYLNNYGWEGYDYKYPQYYTQWYCVGSIDHETRTNGSPLATKNHRSSFSSWFESYTDGNHIVNWLEPGNGIPTIDYVYYDTILQIYRGTWRYSWGTSFSTPYLAAIIALIITGYHRGIGSSTDPSVQKVIDILLYASSRSTFNQKMGYGYVDAYIAYGKAYTEGRLA